MVLSLNTIDDFTTLVPHLIYFRAKLAEISFTVATKILFLRLPSNLRELSLSTWSIEYANGDLWETVLSSKFSHLKHFHLIISLDQIPHNYVTASQADLDNIVKSFNQSKYFLDHHWNVLINVNEHDRLKLVLHTVPYPIENFQTTLYDIRRCTSSPLTIKSAYRYVSKLNLVLHNDLASLSNDNNEYRYFSNVEQFSLYSNLMNDCRQFQSIEYFKNLKNIVNLSNITLLNCPEDTRQYPIELINLLLNHIPKLKSLIVPYRLYTCLKTQSIYNLKSLTLIFTIYSSISPPATRMRHLLTSHQILTNELILELIQTSLSLYSELQTLTLIVRDIDSFDNQFSEWLKTKILIEKNILYDLLIMFINQTHITKFDILPNEILLEIFEYLPTVNIFETFFYLNQRYNRLLLSIRLRIDLLNISKQIFDYYNYFLFPIASQCIISLRCEDIFDRLIHHIHLSNFISLEYLTITNIKKTTLQYIIPHLKKFPNLIYLNLQISNELINNNELYFEESMPSIEKCILNFNKRIIIEGDHCYSNLKYLTINQYHINDLLSFLHIYTPQLHHLTITLNDDYNSIKLLPKIENKHNLETLIIKECRIPFDRIEQLILISLPYLKRLHINAIGIGYADGRQWERLLSTYFPCLIKFILHTTFPDIDASTPNLRTQLLKTFETKYFLSHDWYFAFLHHPSSPMIDLFSLPLPSNKIDVSLYDTYIEKTINNINIFENINELTLYLRNSNENLKLPQSCFSNVKNLILISRFQHNERLPRMLLVDISHLVRFSNLESIEFIENNFPSSMLILLDYTTKLKSLSMSFLNLIQMTKTLSDQHVCQQLTKLIKHLKITSINDVNNYAMFERLPLVFSHLDSLSLSLMNPNDLYPLTILILQKMAPILKTLNLSIEEYIHEVNILKNFMSWLIGYLHSHDLEKVDVKQTDDEIYLCF
ncbi:unnamed protein product [Rotaria sp. Silwood1]|nr:unnamed protein product [Rotaria sp. Silwood1]